VILFGGMVDDLVSLLNWRKDTIGLNACHADYPAPTSKTTTLSSSSSWPILQAQPDGVLRIHVRLYWLADAYGKGATF